MFFFTKFCIDCKIASVGAESMTCCEPNMDGSTMGTGCQFMACCATCKWYEYSLLVRTSFNKNFLANSSLPNLAGMIFGVMDTKKNMHGGWKPSV